MRLLPEAGGAELRVVDALGAIDVEGLAQLGGLLGLVTVGPEDLAEAVGDLHEGEHPVPVCVHAPEDLVDVAQVVVVQLPRDRADAHALESRGAAEVAEVLQDFCRLRLGRLLLSRRGPCLGQPLVLHHFDDGQALCRVRLQQHPDKVLGVGVHLVPGGALHGVAFRTGVPEVLGLAAPEGGLAAEHHICQHAEAPEVAGSRVLLPVF
mmetsp:Transcript_13698/g.43320  ORF Transcript_13698/g.43320 Transcript_13698/m.43320 type:complete len:208 (+) Transcript_13698:523-1146(+)